MLAVFQATRSKPANLRREAPKRSCMYVSPLQLWRLSNKIKTKMAVRLSLARKVLFATVDTSLYGGAADIITSNHGCIKYETISSIFTLCGCSWSRQQRDESLPEQLQTRANLDWRPFASARRASRMDDDVWLLFAPCVAWWRQIPAHVVCISSWGGFQRSQGSLR